MIIGNLLMKRFELFMASMIVIFGGGIFFWIYSKNIFEGVNFFPIPMFIVNIVMYSFSVVFAFIITLIFLGILCVIGHFFGLIDEEE